MSVIVVPTCIKMLRHSIRRERETYTHKYKCMYTNNTIGKPRCTKRHHMRRRGVFCVRWRHAKQHPTWGKCGKQSSYRTIVATGSRVASYGDDYAKVRPVPISIGICSDCTTFNMQIVLQTRIAKQLLPTPTRQQSSVAHERAHAHLAGTHETSRVSPRNSRRISGDRDSDVSRRDAGPAVC